MFDGLNDSRFGYLIEGDTAKVSFGCIFETMGNMPGNGFTFTVGIRGEVNSFGLLGCLFELSNDFFLPLYNIIFRREVILKVDSHLRLGQVANMPDRSHDVILFTQKARKRSAFGRRLDNHKVVCHEQPFCNLN